MFKLCPHPPTSPPPMSESLPPPGTVSDIPTDVRNHWKCCLWWVWGTRWLRSQPARVQKLQAYLHKLIYPIPTLLTFTHTYKHKCLHTNTSLPPYLTPLPFQLVRRQRLRLHTRTLWDSLSNYLLAAEELGKFAKAVFAKAWSACKPQSKLIKYEIRAWITSLLIFWSN